MNKALLTAWAMMAALAMNAETVDRTMYVDFGEVDGNRGGTTVGPDANGHYWTNVKSSGNNYLYPGVTFPIVDSENNETGYDILVNTRFMSNGTAAAGGLTAPKAEYLGDLAVKTATYDYLFVEGFQNFNFFTFRGLDPKKAYRFHTFGCRANDQTRVTKYEFRGLNNWSESHQTSGTGTGADGYNGNNNHISVSDPIYPDENGCITFTMSRVSNMMHVNAMKIEELSDAEPLPITYTLTQTMYIDLGEAPANRNHGQLTEGADANGHYWNNIYNTSGDQVPIGQTYDLVNSANEPSGITAKTLNKLSTNGTTEAGGYETPKAEDLRDLAVATATMDYVYIDANNTPKSTIEFSGLDPKKVYRVSAYGCRITSETGDRNGYFITEGLNESKQYQWFSGRCIGGRDANGKDVHGNIRNVAVSDFVTPTEDGKINFTIQTNVGLAHLNALKIDEYNTTTTAEPVTGPQTFYIDFGEVTPARGGTTDGKDKFGHYWTNIKTSGNNYTYPGTTYRLINSENQISDYEAFINTRYMSNGTTAAGGLTNPKEEYLGDLAVESATYDYIFAENFQDYNFMTFRNLDPQKAYRFSSFGCRAADDVRMGEYIFKGQNSWSTTYQTSGAGLGKDGYNGNNSNISVSDPIFPDENGCITFTLHRVQGMFYINAMKMEEVEGLTRPENHFTLEQSVYIDLGEESTHRNHGKLTEGADANGHYWNNIYNTSGDQVPIGHSYELVNSANEPSGITATTLNRLSTNGTAASGGFENPEAKYLGDFAVATATMDYVYIDANNTPKSTIEFSGLDPQKAYRVSAYGCRITDETGDRNGYFITEGLNSSKEYQWFSGRGCGGQGVHGNTMNVAVSDYIFPDTDGKIRFTLQTNKGLAHLNAMKIEQFDATGAERPAQPLKSLTIKGTSAENAEGVAMRELTEKGTFVAYTRLGEGSYTIEGTDEGGNTLSYGIADGKLTANGAATEVAEATVARIYANTKTNTVTVTPITSMAVKGVIVPANTTLAYAGNGRWEQEVALDKTTGEQYLNRSIYFALNGDDTYAIRRSTNSDVAGVAADGFSGENIRLNNGTYTLTVDLTEGKVGVAAEIDPYRVSVFGSSVANGQGAENFRGYAYLYGEQLKKRTDRGDSEYPLYTSGVSIGGNTTTNLLNRYDDVIHDFGHFVVIGLSLGNEGIHGAGNPEAIFNQFANNMQTLISKLRADGKEVVVMNNYTRGDYNDTDYSYVKRTNMLIHKWDVPSVNTLGSIDDGAGHWADGFITDVAHPNTSGHKQFMQAIVPSLFDALIEGKAQPVRNLDAEGIRLTGGSAMAFTPEETVNAFTADVRFRGNGAGDLLRFLQGKRGTTIGSVTLDEAGHICYQSPVASKDPIVSATAVSADSWHHMTLTHYYAMGKTFLYLDGVKVGEVTDKLIPSKFIIGDISTPREIGEVSFWRAGMTAEEIKHHTDGGELLKSSLEIYTPCHQADTETQARASYVKLPNLAQSLNAMDYDHGNTLGVSDIEGDEIAPFSVSTTAGTITVEGEAGTKVTVAAADGRIAAVFTLEGEAVSVPAAPGIYLVNNVKVAVR